MNNNITENQQNQNILIDEENKESIIPVVYFDEMGLAEENPHNPLKVMHSKLEYDDREQYMNSLVYQILNLTLLKCKKLYY